MAKKEDAKMQWFKVNTITLETLNVVNPSKIGTAFLLGLDYVKYINSQLLALKEIDPKNSEYKETAEKVENKIKDNIAEKGESIFNNITDAEIRIAFNGVKRDINESFEEYIKSCIGGKTSAGNRAAEKEKLKAQVDEMEKKYKNY